VGGEKRRVDIGVLFLVEVYETGAGDLDIGYCENIAK
jgi:hypothetical protein